MLFRLVVAGALSLVLLTGVGILGGWLVSDSQARGGDELGIPDAPEARTRADCQLLRLWSLTIWTFSIAGEVSGPNEQACSVHDISISSATLPSGSPCRFRALFEEGGVTVFDNPEGCFIPGRGDWSSEIVTCLPAAPETPQWIDVEVRRAPEIEASYRELGLIC